LKKITTWRDGSTGNGVIAAIELKWFDAQETASTGDKHGASNYYEFGKDEKITKMNIRWGNKVDQIAFETDKGGQYQHGGTSSGNVASLNVGNGKIVSAHGRSGWLIDKLGFDFN
jgi:hypothetical protein